MKSIFDGMCVLSSVTSSWRQRAWRWRRRGTRSGQTGSCFSSLSFFSPVCLLTFVLFAVLPAVIPHQSYLVGIVVKGPVCRLVETLIHSCVFISIIAGNYSSVCLCNLRVSLGQLQRKWVPIHYVAPYRFSQQPRTVFFVFFTVSATIGEGEMRCIQLVAIWNITDRCHLVLHTGPIKIHLAQAESLVFLMTPAG